VPQLMTFTIGGQSANITRDSDGKNMVSLTWPWTGRMEEWLMEKVPEIPDGFEEDKDEDDDVFGPFGDEEEDDVFGSSGENKNEDD
jgi:hypothetical protein